MELTVNRQMAKNSPSTVKNGIFLQQFKKIKNETTCGKHAATTNDLVQLT